MAVLEVRRAAPRPYSGQNPTMHVVLSDVHFPFEDKVTIELFKGFCRAHQPAVIHLLGDIVDFYTLSRFLKDPDRKETVVDDCQRVTEFLRELRELCPGSTIIMSEGNHEFRLQRYIWTQARELAGLDCLTVDKLLKLDESHIWWRGAQWYRWNGQMVYLHGEVVRKQSAASARAHLDKVQYSLIHGHSHRFGVTTRTAYNTVYRAYENGCAADLTKVDYDKAPDWQLGWSVVWHEPKAFHVEQVHVSEGVYAYHGRQYGTYNPGHGYRHVEDLAGVNSSTFAA